MHCHSTYSDGSLSPSQLVSLAARLGLQCLSLTDHDTMRGSDEAAEAAASTDIRFIPGVEISAYDFSRDKKVHILGYSIDKPEMIDEACAPFLKSRHELSLVKVVKIRQAGYPLTVEDALSHTGPDGTLYRQHIMHALVDMGYATAIYGDLNKILFKNGGPADLKSEYMDARDAVRLVREAGGIAAMAHPFLYESVGTLPELIDAGLTALECHHSSHVEGAERYAYELSERYDLMPVGGSDFHGFYSEWPIALGSVGMEDCNLLHPIW